MTWFRVDDVLTFHPRVVRAGNAAMGLWLRAGTWCSEHLTDGWIAHDDARALGSATEVKRLVTVGLWVPEERNGEAGYQFHRWSTNGVGDKRNPTRAEIEERRAADRARKSKGGRTTAAQRADSDRNPDGVRADSTRTPPAPVPSRPVPSQKETSDEVSPGKARKRPYPKDFAPTDEHRTYAAEHRLDLAAQLSAFRDHALMTGRQGIDWNAGFRNWLKKAVEFAAEKPKPKAGTDDWMNQ